MLITSHERLTQYTGDITPREMGRCHKIVGPNSSTIFYLVENKNGKYNRNKKLIEYKVVYSQKRGYTCTCRSGMQGFINVTKHASGVCWHVRAVVACILEERAYMEALKVKEAEREEIRRNAEAQAQEEQQPATPTEPEQPPRQSQKKPRKPRKVQPVLTA